MGGETFLNNNWILLRFNKIFIKVYVQQVFVNVRWNFISSRHYVRQVVKNYLQPCVQTFKKLLRSESVSRSDLINWVYLSLKFSILLSYVFFKTQTWLQIEIHIYVNCFPLLIFCLSFKHKIVYNDVKLYHAFLSSQFTVFTISKPKQVNDKSFYCLLITLSGDISLNPGPVCKHQLLNTMEWDISKQKVCI